MSSSAAQLSSSATAVSTAGSLNSDLMGLDPNTGTSPVSWNQPSQSLIDSSYPQSSTPPMDQSQQPLQPSPVFNQSGAILQPSPVFNQSGTTLQSSASQSGATLQPSPVFNQSGATLQPSPVSSNQSTSPSQEQSRSRQNSGQNEGSPVAPPRGAATPVPPAEEVINLFGRIHDFREL